MKFIPRRLGSLAIDGLYLAFCVSSWFLVWLGACLPLDAIGGWRRSAVAKTPITRLTSPPRCAVRNRTVSSAATIGPTGQRRSSSLLEWRVRPGA